MINSLATEGSGLFIHNSDSDGKKALSSGRLRPAFFSRMAWLTGIALQAVAEKNSVARAKPWPRPLWAAADPQQRDRREQCWWGAAEGAGRAFAQRRAPKGGGRAGDSLRADP